MDDQSLRTAKLPKPLVLVHIPKTAGTTLHKVIWHQFSPKRVHVTHDAVSETMLADARRVKGSEASCFDAVIGHLGLGLHEVHPTSRYVSCVREPVSRLKSHYHYARSTPGHYLYDEIVKNGYSFCEYICSGISGELSNGMTRTFAGLKDYHGAMVDHDTFQLAQDNIRNQFVFVGLTERFDQSLMILKRMLGWKSPYYIRRKTGNYSSSKEKLGGDERRAIEEANLYDIELYQWLVKRFDEAAMRYSETEMMTTRFGRANGSYGKAVFCFRELVARAGLRAPI